MNRNLTFTLLAAFLLTTLDSSCGISEACDADPSSEECHNDFYAFVRGYIEDAEGAQRREFGGSGTASAAASVRAMAVADDGSLTLLAEAMVQADGSYELEAPAGRERVVMQATNADGEVVASAFLDAIGSEGSMTTCTPINSESSVEASVIVEMFAQAGSASAVDPADARARLDADVAAAVQVSVLGGADGEATIAALAEATLAAQATEIEAYAQAGISVSQEQMYQAEIAASAQLAVALDAAARSGGSGESAYAEFLASLEASAESRGADAEAQGRAEACAGMAFRATIDARLGASAGLVSDAAVRAAASLEARAQANATVAILAAAGAGSAATQAGADAGAELRASIRAAADASAAASAYASFGASVRGGGGVVEALVEPGLTTMLALTTSVSASATAAATLDATLATTFDTALGATGALDLEALAEAVVVAYGTYFVAVQAQTTALAAAFGQAQADATVSLLIAADGSYRQG